MRILFLIHQFFPDHIGGTEVYLKGLLNFLKKYNHSLRVITCKENPSGNSESFFTKEIILEGINILEIHFNLSVSKNPLRWEYNNPYVKEIIKAEIISFKPHIAHVMHGLKLSGSALEAFDQSKVPFITTLSDFWFICPRHTLLKWDGKVCEGKKSPFGCKKCVEDLHRDIPKGVKWIDKLNQLYSYWQRNRFLKRQVLKSKKIIALSHFQKSAFVKNGYPEKRIRLFPMA